MAEVSEIRYARSGDIDIAYQVPGEGPIDLVFVSGFVSHLDLNWESAWYDWLRRMNGVVRVTVFDKRGTGLSERSLGFGNLAVRIDASARSWTPRASRRPSYSASPKGAPKSDESANDSSIFSLSDSMIARVRSSTGAELPTGASRAAASADAGTPAST